MASHVVEGYSGPLPPPPAVYLRSSPPPAPVDSPPAPPQLSSAEAHRQEPIKPAVANIPKRKPVSIPPLNVDDNAVMHNSPVSPVRIDGHPLTLPQASSARIENVTVDGSKSSSDMADRTKENLPPRRSSLAAAAASQHSPYLAYRPKPENGFDATRTLHQRNVSQSSVPYRVSDETSQSKSRHGSSHGSVESIPQNNEVYEPLQYHHQPFRGHLAERNGKRGSKSTLVSNSDSSSMGDPTNSQNHLAPNRRSRANLIPRPNSAYSSTSELAGRGRSPHLSPNAQIRAVSANSTGSGDARPLSFVDLLNVPYPQPPPAPATLSNAHLRSSVGNNASLLSHKQTFDMYLANVKKTNDAGAQYEFAVFMIHATQEQQDDQNGGPPSDMVSDIPKAELLREAKSILQRLADRSYPYAQYYLADGYASGLFNKGKPDLDKAFPLFVAASKHGHAEAGYRAALCYEFGWGSRKDGAKAVQFYRQAASKNHPGAMSRLGRACLSGDMGQMKKYREGITWLKRAAESADMQYNSAPYDLGVLHETGYGDDVFQDESYAAQLFTRAAELGHAEASYRLGDAYEHGKLNCPRDPALSVHFYTGAAQLGHPTAMMALCAWFMVGAEPILEKDEYEAYEWARRAADMGLAKAEYAVGYFTEMGIGCQRDPLEANVWYVRAADQGDERAKHRIAAIRAAASGANPKSAASNRKQKGQDQQEQVDGSGKGKRFGIF